MDAAIAGERPAKTQYLAGALFGMAAAGIWPGWFVTSSSR
jgi:hypothetical protein